MKQELRFTWEKLYGVMGIDITMLGTCGSRSWVRIIRLYVT